MNNPLDRLSSPMRWLLVAATAIIIIILLLYYGGEALNWAGNKVFEWRTGKKLEQVQKQLQDAEAQKKELEKTLLELKQAKEDLAKATKAREEAEAIFNDKSKTARDKVAAFEEALRDAPVRTPTSGITADDLCQRAKAAGADAAVVSALCGR